MKKLSIMMLGVLGMMAASCDEAPEAPKPQENPQEPIFAVGDLTSSTDGALASSSVLNLENYREESGIPVMKAAQTKNLPAGATVSYQLQLCANEDFSGKVMTLNTSMNSDSVYVVNPVEWNDAHVALFGKSPKVKTVYYRVPVYVIVDGSSYRYDSVDSYAATGTIEEQCMDLGFVIEEAYYLIGNLNNWGLNTDMPFTHSDKDVYDDPMFVITFKVDQAVLDANGGGCYWKIAPKSSVEAQNWDTVLGPEVNGDTAETGLLVDSNAQAGMFDKAGNYKMTINMESMTYTVEHLLRPEYLYTPGGVNGWNQEASSWMQYNADMGYYGMFPVNGDGFKVCAAKNWDNETTYGAVTEDGANSGNFVLGQEGKNIHPAAPGLYWLAAKYDQDLGVLTTYNFTPITRVGVIGSFAASGWGSDIEMTANDNQTVWTVEVEMTAGSEWKIRFNDGWDYNFGDGGDDKAVYNAGNFKVDEDGTYIVTMTLQPGVPTAKAVKK